MQFESALVAEDACLVQCFATIFCRVLDPKNKRRRSERAAFTTAPAQFSWSGRPNR
jgi:hypothetical protein